jgi:hypothetical protein
MPRDTQSSLVLLVCLLTACGEKSSPPPPIPAHEIITMEQTPLNTEQQKQLQRTMIARAITILTGQITLDVENDPVFGKGEYFWPKDPKKPIKAFAYFKKTTYPNVRIDFKRQDENASWTYAGLFFGGTTLQKSDGQLSSLYFSQLGLTFDSAYRKPDINAPDDSNQGSNHFVFRLQSDPRIAVEFGGDQHLSDLSDKFPKMFLYCIVTNGQ